MSRLTRCPACTTVFRVTGEQLDSRQGFVRCGQCAKVFDARASLMAEREPETSPHDAGPGTEDTSASATGGDAAAVGAPFAAQPDATGGTLAAAGESPDEPSVAASPSTDGSPVEEDPFEGMDVEEIVLSLDQPDGDATAPDIELPAAQAAEAGDATPPASVDAASAVAAAAPIAATALRPPPVDDDAEPLPFGPKHRARSRAAALGWGAGALMLLIVLGAQAAYWFRGELATAVPEARPYLELACRQLNCTVPPPRQIALLSIESSELQVDKNVPGLLTLNATLRNRAAFAQQHPSIELTLTDADDRPMSRRVLAPADYLGDRLAKEPLFAAVSEHTVRLHIDATAFRPTGYRLFLFHP